MSLSKKGGDGDNSADPSTVSTGHLRFSSVRLMLEKEVDGGSKGDEA